MHDLLHLHSLAPAGQHGQAITHGAARLRAMRPAAHTVDNIPTPAHMPKAHRGESRCGHCARAVAVEVIKRTAQDWDVTA